MALEKDIELESGIVGDYIRINWFQVSKESCAVHVLLYANKMLRDAGKSAIGSFQYPFPAGTINSWTEAYNMLKTIWPDAIDC